MNRLVIILAYLFFSGSTGYSRDLRAPHGDGSDIPPSAMESEQIQDRDSDDSSGSEDKSDAEKRLEAERKELQRALERQQMSGSTADEESSSPGAARNMILQGKQHPESEGTTGIASLPASGAQSTKKEVPRNGTLRDRLKRDNHFLRSFGMR